MISSDAEVKSWSKEKKIPYFEPTANLPELFSKQPFDYLFSIVNEHILREDVLRLPRKLAINYHDGLLPRYAGTHATSWALMNGETVHGITWHLMTNVVDAGDILKQQSVEIAENDTALTLNTKCYEAAISSFSQLVGELASGSAAAKEQNLGDRTLFARYKRPATACVISWRRRASDIDALVRALSFGAHANPLGIPKLALDNDFVIIPEIEILNSVSHTPPGTITKTGADFLCVSTKDREVVMRKALTLQGRPISMPDLVARYNLHPGYRFADPDAAIAGRLEAIYAASSRHEEFWVKRLASLKPAELPYTNSRASSTEVHGHAEMPMDIPDEIFRFLEEQRPEWSTGDFLLAAYGAFIARLGGVNSFDVAYGESDLQSEVAGLDKLFAIHLPLRMDIDCSQSFTEILRAVTAQVKSVRNHSTYSHDLVARYPELRSILDSGGTFILPLAVQRVERLNDYKIPTGCEVLLSISENGSGCRWIYDRDKLEEASAIRLRDHFATFLRSIIANPKKPVASLTLLTEEERHQLLVDWNDNHADYPKDQCIHHLFEEQAARTPDAGAVIFGERRLSYLQLNQQANQLAHFLRTLGVGPEVPVGICVERSLEMIIGLLGVLKAGAAYVPLDPAYPKERLSFKLQDSQAPVLLTQRRLASGFNQQAVRIVCLDTDWKVIAQESERNPSSNVTPENLAYIIYTSGSTGRPKGVVIAHSALVSHSVSVVKHYELDPSDRVLQFASIGFDVAAEEILATLLSGAAVVLSVGQVPPSVSDFIALIEKERLTVINLPSCYWHELVLELDLSQRRLCSTLRLVVTGSDRVLPHRLTTWRKMFGDSIRWLNAYGPTETTVTATIYEPAGDDSDCETGAVPIGRPMANRQVYILDSYLNPVPVGVPGELYIGGAGLARGYLNSPDITSEKFIPNPFQRELGAKLYKTGDRARYLPDGNIEFLGRMDRQVKVRGFRIELDEIEDALVQHPSVRACAVVAREDKEGETKLIAYLAPAVDKLQLGPSLDEYLVRDDLDDKEKQGDVASHHLSVSGAAGFKRGSPCHINSQEVRSMQNLVPPLRHLLQEKLPDYMVPSAFVMLDELPLTPNGKVNPQALPTSELSAPKLESAFIPLRDPVALQLTSIWEDVLGIRSIGMDDNFFEVGGHSLQGVRMFAEVEKTFGKNIPLAILLEAGTIRKLADILRQDNWSAPESSLVAIQPNGPKPPFFCIHALRGKVLLYRELAWHLGLDQPFYGLQARHLNGLRNDYESVEEMAEYYIKEIQTIQPEGPYFLGGLSFGGLAAFEMARQLYAEGHKVALLALFDAGTPDYERLEVDDFVRRAQHHWEMLGLLNLQGKVEYVLSKAGRVIGTYYKKLNRKHGIMGPRKFHSMHQRLPLNDFQVEDKIRQAFERYVPPVYPGKMTLFRAASRPPGVHQDPMLGWEGIATGGLEIHEVPGDHGSIVVEPHVGPLAETLKRCLEKAHAEANQAEQAQSGALF